MSFESSRDVYSHFTKWFWMKVGLPFLLLLFMWVFYLMGNLRSPFTAAFAHGEILIFGAVLLIELSFEADQLAGVSKRYFDEWFESIRPMLQIAAFFLICMFGFMRYDVMSITASLEHDASSDILSYKLIAYSVLSLVIGATCVCIAIYACLAYCEQAFASRIKDLTG